jgi:hypothetical protein
VGFFAARKGEGRADTLSLDRRDSSLGYQKGNLQILTVSANARKASREDRLPESVKAILRAKLEAAQAFVEKEYFPF